MRTLTILITALVLGLGGCDSELAECPATDRMPTLEDLGGDADALSAWHGGYEAGYHVTYPDDGVPAECYISDALCDAYRKGLGDGAFDRMLCEASPYADSL